MNPWLRHHFRALLVVHAAEDGPPTTAEAVRARAAAVDKLAEVGAKFEAQLADFMPPASAELAVDLGALFLGVALGAWRRDYARRRLLQLLALRAGITPTSSV